MNRQKHKLSRRILAVLLMAAMLITMLPSAMFAWDGGGNSGGNDQGTIVTAQNSVTTDDRNIEEFSKSATRTGANTWDISMIVDPKNDIQTIPMDVVLVIDKSNSMKWGIDGENDHSKSRMEYVKSAAKNLVDQLAEVGNVNVGVVSFNYNDKVERELTSLNQTFNWTTGEKLVNDAIDDISYGKNNDGGTDIYDGLVAAEEVLNDGGAQNNKVVILLSDGDYSEDCKNPWQQANEMKKDGTTIYTIGFADQEGEGTLKAVASEGKFYQANNSTELNNVFSNIAEEIIAMVTDNVGDDVTIVDNTMVATVNQTPNENIVVDSDNKGFRWNPDDEEGLSGDETLNINYGVSLDKTAQQLWNENYQATVVLNDEATLFYRVGNKNQTPLNLESLKVDVELAKLTVANDIDGEENPVRDSDQYIFVYKDNSFTWTKPANELSGATYTGSTIEFVGSEDVDATGQTSYGPSVKGEYKLVHHYTTGLNGSDVTVQVVVDGQVTKEPLKYVDIIRSVGNEDYNKFDESGPDANGTLTYDFDYYAEDGFDCVDLDVRLTENAAADYVLQGVHSYQSYGESGTSNVTPPEVGKDHGYIVDNVAANLDNDIDCTIYLRSKYSVKYHLNDAELTAGDYQGAYVDDNKYIETEDVKNASTSKPEEQGEFAWMDWKNSGGYATTLTLLNLPNVKDSTVSGWFLANDKATELSGTFNTVKPTLDTADGNTDGVIHFYATSTANPKDLTAFNKEVVTSAVDEISGDYQYPEKEGDRYTLTVDEGTEVTLLYKITVEGNAGAKFDVTDKDAKLVKVITADVTIDDTTEDHFTGTIPSGGKVEFYVATDFGAVTADRDLKNVASVSNTNGGKDPDDPDEEVTVPVDVTPVYKITSIDKFYISSSDDLTEETASKIDMSKYAVPDTESEKVIVPNDGTSVTLLYGITVSGTSGATFEVTDTGAELVTYQADEVIDGKAAISGANGVFTGTIPDDGELTFYVSKQFDKDDIKDGNLNNTAAITEGDIDPDNENDEDTEKVPAEEEKATIDSIDKFYVNPEKPGFSNDETSPAIDLSEYVGLDENGNIVIPENGTVTVLYGITVTGTPGASFYVMDDSASFVSVQSSDVLGNDKLAVSGASDIFEGTFPKDGEVTFYVSKTFDASDINNGQITNIAEAKLVDEKETIKATEINNAIVEEAVEIPDDEDLIALIGGQITVDCVNSDVEHLDKIYQVDKEHYTVSDLTTNADGQPTFTVAIDTNAYITEYSKEIGKEHTLYSVEGQPVEGQYEFTFTWDGIKWVVNPEDALTIRVECEYGITGIDKFLVADSDQKEATGLTEDKLARFTFPDEKGRINLPKDGKVTLLYGITVTGVTGEEFTVTDENALLTPKISTNVENLENGIFTGTIPEGGSITFYVEKVFTIDDVKTGLVENEESLVNVAEITEGDIIPGKEDDEEIVPVATGYSLTYEANGGYFANDAAKTTATVGELNPAQYDLWSDEAGTIPVDENGKELAKPTHAQAAPPEDTVISDADLVDVELIGWTTEVPESAGQIYAAGDKYPTLTDKATIKDDNVTVYAVWGYDENNDGVADATQIVITPADITIYSGGTGYEGVLGENGELVGTEGAQNGLPEPGYYFILPYQLNDKLGGATNIIDLSGKLHLDYVNQDNANDVRGWNLELYSKSNPEQSMAYGKYVYRLIPETAGYPVRLEIKDGDTLVSSDNFTISLDSLSKTYSMKLYTDPEVDRVQVTAQIRNDEDDWVDANEALGDNVVQGIARGTATLTIRGTTEDQPVSAIQNTVAEEVDAITAVEPENVDYYINGSKIPVVMNESASNVQLLNDTIVNESGSQDVMENAIVSEAANDPDVNIDADYAFDFRYLDLVDTDNGNAYVTMGEGQEMTIYWPYPEGMDQDDTFYIAHFDGLDREFTAEELNTAVANSDLKLYHEGDATYELETTEFGIKFTTSSFSPFALVYDASQADDGDDNPPYYPWHPDGDDDGPSGLNTEDHFSYVVGYAEDYRTGEATDDEDLWPVKPNNQITRAEVATIFYRLLEDEVRDEYDTTTNDFSDVTADSWYNQTVSTLARMGIVKGYEDGSFRPNAPITRAEFGAIATRFFAETGATYEPGTFTDVTGNEWFANAIQDAVNLGLIGGYPDGTVRPNNNITRAEACAIVNRTLGRVPDADHLLPEDVMKVWPDNNPTDWFYADMQEATNGHEYAWIEEDGHEIEEWTNLLDKDWTDR